MDPHSRHSQFNSRQPRTGPIMPGSRFMEGQTKPFKPMEEAKHTKRSPPTPKSTSVSLSSLYTSRPIATNSRIKQDEQYRKDMYLAYVTNALQQKNMGVSDAFDELVDQFNPRKSGTGLPSTAGQLRSWILALSHVVSRLERTHVALVEAIVNLPWTTMDTAFIKSYIGFIGMLVSARPEYLSLVLAQIARGFTYHSGVQAMDSGLPESSSNPLTRRVVYDRIHYLLRHLMALIPTLPSTLQPLLVQNFPHKRQPQAAQITYIRNLLRVTEYCPGLSDRVLSTIVDRAIQIDVEIQVELEELEEQMALQEQSEMFELDPFDTLVGQEGEDPENADDDNDDDDAGDDLSDISSDAGGDDDEEPPVDVPTNVAHIQSMVNKLDAIIKTLFDHFNASHAITSPVHVLPVLDTVSPLDTPPQIGTPRSPSPDSAERGRDFRRSQFLSLLSIFDRIILRTFKSRYTQFIIFWYSSLDPDFSDLFQGFLLEKSLLGEGLPAVTRAAAASYIASFVSRAQFVGRDSTREAVKLLCDFLRSRLDMFDADVQTGSMTFNLTQHSVFYAVAQAVFLIFCFRWRDLLEDHDDIDEFTSPGVPIKKWMPELDVLHRAVNSDLNPLKVCSSNVVMQFARVAHATDFIYCYSIMEANKRSEYASAPSTPTTGRYPNSGSRSSGIPPSILGNSVTSELNTFFPFDPYKLPRSSSYIDGVYREWSSVAIDDDEEEEDDEDEDEEEELEEVQGDHPHGIPVKGLRPHPQDDDDSVLGASFGGMSISPLQPAGPIALVS